VLKAVRRSAETEGMTRAVRPVHRWTDDRGFTLVELLVVMIVLGVLAAIAVPTATLQRRKAYETSAKADVKVITKEVLALHVDGAAPTPSAAARHVGDPRPGPRWSRAAR
jgi:prepilin-type N-terminal cleavage/methylation domain-containing protein